MSNTAPRSNHERKDAELELLWENARAALDHTNDSATGRPQAQATPELSISALEFCICALSNPGWQLDTPPAPSHQSTTEFSPPSAAPGQRIRAKNDLRIFTAQCSPRGLLTFSSARSYLAECDIMVVYLSVYTV